MLNIVWISESSKNAKKLDLQSIGSSPDLQRWSSSSNTMIQIGNLDLGRLIDTLKCLATPTLKSSK